MPNESLQPNPFAGRGGLAAFRLEHASGSRAEVYLHGAHVTSFVSPAGDEMLFVSERSSFEDGTAIRGGVPVIFPQFADEGPLPKHGFARTMTWSPNAQGVRGGRVPYVSLMLEDDDRTRELWPHSFVAHVTVSLDESLTISLDVLNRGRLPMPFTAALHTYLRVTDVEQASVLGLAGARLRDKVAGGAEQLQEAGSLDIRGETDRIYLGARPVLRVRDRAGARAIEVHAEGFPDAVIWNPGPDLASRLLDLGGVAWRQMLCVEAASIGAPVTLGAGERWRGQQTLVPVAG